MFTFEYTRSIYYEHVLYNNILSVSEKEFNSYSENSNVEI